MLQGVVVYVDDLIVVVYVDDLIVAKHNKYYWKIPHVSKISLIKAEWCWFIVPRDTCWTSESDRFYEITFVRKYVRNELISETALTIFLKLGMKLGDNKGKKIARPDFL